MEIKLLDLMVSLGVFQTCWLIIKTNLLEVFQYFFENAQFDKSLNATFISLIPKKFDVVEVRDFWPISLIFFFFWLGWGGVYKIIFKVLANKLKMVQWCLGTLFSNLKMLLLKKERF